jgi:predicted SAM-dependent methyltransferase
MGIMVTRLEKILACIDVSTAKGLEVGALNNPIVTHNMGQIRYIDHATTEELQAKYAQDGNVDINQIVDVNYVWGKESLPDLVGQDAPFDYLVASHVVEHVPDLIGWLKEIHAVLKVGGILSLVIPDKRYCFDYHRQPTKMAEVIEAFLHHARKPSPRQVFEFKSSAVRYNGNIAWSPEDHVEPQQLEQIHSDREAWEVAQFSMQEAQYVDVHCWVFTPHSFFELLKALIHLGLIDFQVEQFYETFGCEFYVSLKALDVKNLSVSDRQALQLASLPNLAPEVSPSAQHISRLQRKKQNQANKIQRLTLRLAEAQQQVSDLQNSKSWKITAPLRWLHHTLKPLR